MISFQSENLQYKIYKTDPIDISVHINASKLDHIFKEYLYFTTSEKLSNGQIVLNYDLRSDKFDELFADDVLGSTAIYWLSLHYMYNSLNSSEIKMVTNTDYPNYVELYFNQKLTSASYGIMTTLTKSTEYVSSHLWGIRDIAYETLSIINQECDQLVSHKLEKYKKSINNNMVIVNTDTLSENDIKLAHEKILGINNSISLFNNATRFAFKLTIHGTDYYILFSTNYNNYIIGNRLMEAFKLMDLRLNNIIQKQNRVSYIYNNEVFKQNKSWFTEGYDDKTFINGEIGICNSYVYNQVKTKYQLNNAIFTQEEKLQNSCNLLKNKIKKYIDEVGKGTAFFDFNSELVNSIIGNPDDYFYLGIYGYDEENQRPIILGINKDYETSGSWYRNIKIISGGITAINNDELKNNIIADNYKYLLQTTLIDVKNIHYMDMFKMVADVNGFDPVYPKELQLFNAVDSKTKFFYNSADYNMKGETVKGWVYKQYEDLSSAPTASFTMRSFIIDGNDAFKSGHSFVGIRDIKFYYKGSPVTITDDDIEAHYANVKSNHNFKKIFTTSDTWTYIINDPTKQRCQIEFKNNIQVDSIRFSNYHVNGNNTFLGLKHASFYISEDKISENDDSRKNEYGYNLKNTTQVFNDYLNVHNNKDESDYQIITPQIITEDVDKEVYEIQSLILDVGQNQSKDPNDGSYSQTFGMGSINFYYKNNKINISDSDIEIFKVNGVNNVSVKNIINEYYYNDILIGNYNPNVGFRIVLTLKNPIICDEIRAENYLSRDNLENNKYGIKDVVIRIASFKQTEAFTKGLGNSVSTEIFSGTFRKHINYNTNEEYTLKLLKFNDTILKRSPKYTLLTTDSSFIENEADDLTHSIPYDLIIKMFNITDKSAMMKLISDNFITETITDFDEIEYNNMFIKYIPILNGHTMNLVSHKNSVVGFRLINELLLNDLSFDVKYEMLEKLWSATHNIDKYHFVLGKDVVTINDDSEFNSNSKWATEIFTGKDNNIIEKHSFSSSKLSDFLTMMMNENMYHTEITEPSGKYVCAMFKLNDVALNSFNKSIIFNKVIGSDWYSYYSLKTEGDDLTFSGYFINSYTDNNYAQQMLDLDVGKVKALTSVPFDFNCGVANPIISNLECIEDNSIYVIDKDEYDKVYDRQLNIFKIYNLDQNQEVIYSRKPFNNKTNKIFNVYSNDYVIIKKENIGGGV